MTFHMYVLYTSYTWLDISLSPLSVISHKRNLQKDHTTHWYQQEDLAAFPWWERQQGPLLFSPSFTVECTSDAKVDNELTAFALAHPLPPSLLITNRLHLIHPPQIPCQLLYCALHQCLCPVLILSRSVASRTREELVDPWGKGAVLVGPWGERGWTNSWWRPSMKTEGAGRGVVGRGRGERTRLPGVFFTEPTDYIHTRNNNTNSFLNFINIIMLVL